MDELNRFIARESFPRELSQRMRGYFHQSKHLRASKQQQKMLASMPPTLQGEVSWATNSTWLSAIWFLKGCEPQFMLELSLQMHAVVFSPSDIAPDGYLFMIQRGVALYNSKVLTKGKVFGEDMILQDATLRSRASARAMNYLEANYVSRTELIMLSNRYPDTKAKIRRAAILMSLRREIVRLAARIKKHKAESFEQFLAKGGSAGEDDGGAFGGGNSLLEAIDVAKTAEMTNAVEKEKEGGRLEGHANDIGVQFEIVGEEFMGIKLRLDEQGESYQTTRKELAELRRGQEQILQALAGLAAIQPGVREAMAAATSMGGKPQSRQPSKAPSNHPYLMDLPNGQHGGFTGAPTPMTATPMSQLGQQGYMNGGGAAAMITAAQHGGSMRSAEDRLQDGQWQNSKGAPPMNGGAQQQPSPPLGGADRERHKHRHRHRSRRAPPGTASLLDA